MTPPRNIARIFLPFLFCAGLLQELQGQWSETPVDSDSTTFETNDTALSPLVGRDLWVGLGGGAGLFGARRLLGLQEASVTVGGFLDDSHWIQLTASYLHTPLPSTSDPEYVIVNGLAVAELQADIRFFTPPRYSFLGHYFFVGAGLDIAFWSYDPREYFAGSETNGSDYVLGYDLHVGTGFVLGQFWPLTLNLDLSPGILLWSSGKEEEYARADLPILLYFKVRVQLSYAIPGL